MVKFADALRIYLPETLAENAGMDPIDTQVELRAKHGQGKKWLRDQCPHGKVSDMMADHIIEPTAVKEQIIRSATEAASMILRIDDLIASGKSKAPASAAWRPRWNGWI